MATKVIKLQDSNDNILIPVTSASYVQTTDLYGNVTSAADEMIMLEFAITNHSERIGKIEENINKVATNSSLGVVKGGSSSGTTMGVNVSSDGSMTVNHYKPTGTPTSVTASTNLNLSPNSSRVIVGLSYNVDANGHVTSITAATGTLPPDNNTDTKVEFKATSDANKYPLIFKSSTGSTTTADGVRFDSSTDSAYYVPSTHSAFINTTYHAASYLAGNEMVGFKRINSNMDTLSLFSASDAPSTLGVMFRDRYNNAILPVTSSDMIEVNYGGTSKILTSLLQENEQVTTEALIDLYNRINNYSTGFATISYQSSSLSNGGIVSGVVKNNMNRTSGNVTTIRTVNETEQVSGGTGTARTLLRYETPLINIAMGTPNYNNMGEVASVQSTFPATNSSTINKNYYDPIKNNTNKANIYGTGSTDVAYAPMVDGNNYCDVSSSTYEMYFFNTNKLRNYLTAYARIDFNKPYLKEINGDTIFQWGPYDNADDNQSTLTLRKGEINFNKEHILWEPPSGISHTLIRPVHHTRITPEFIQTNTFKAFKPDDQRFIPAQRIEVSYESINVVNNEGNQAVLINGSQSTFNHTAYAKKFMETSDERLKTSISPIAYDPDGIGIYTFIKNEYDSYSYGFIAQNVAETHPELVSEDKDTSYLSVDYNSTLSLLLAKALNRIDELEKRVSELEKTKINDPELI